MTRAPVEGCGFLASFRNEILCFVKPRKSSSLNTTFLSFQRFIYFHRLYLLGCPLQCSSLERYKYINLLFCPKRDHLFSGKANGSPHRELTETRRNKFSYPRIMTRWGDPIRRWTTNYTHQICCSERTTDQKLMFSCSPTEPVSVEFKQDVDELLDLFSLDFVLWDFSQNRTKKWMFKPHPLATNVTTWWKTYFPKPKTEITAAH